jgi:hypothetical protein
MTKEEVLREMRKIFPCKSMKVSEDSWYSYEIDESYIRYSVWINDRWIDYADSLEELLNKFKDEFPPKNEILFRKFEL